MAYQRNKHNVKKYIQFFTTLSLYGSVFVRLAVIAFEIPKNSPKIWTNSSSCIIDFGANGKRMRICMQLPISH